ncbi:FAST kinase domain-containing protein 4 isoform X4 [Poecile atricapillus]|uniref:FAST kinase domain-containing protein 4 isoform X4 n=1 Tax=Poecile atricapillus TaxID=48891 RepID=UPI0027392C1D|nr:FAST kinase domain-containing protein 4 isoform X4 [Poecile atricapillus]
MAAHLFGRCCRRLLPLRSPAGPAPLPAPAPRSEGPRELIRGPAATERELRELIRGAGSPQELLRLGPALGGNLAALAIGRLARISSRQRLDTATIRGDPRFQQLLRAVDAQISQVWNTALVQLLRSLHALGLAADGQQVRSVEQEVLWRLRRLPLRQLAHLAEHLAGQGGDSPLLPEVLRKLELRWTELDGARSVVTLMAKVGHLSPALMERLEDKALELAEQFDAEELCRVALALALQQRRSVPLLRAVSYHLLQKPAQLPLPVLTDLLFAFSKLSFQQPQVLHRLAQELQPHLGSLSPAQVSRCARSFASLRWLSRPLAEAIAQYCLENTQDLSLTQLCGILVSFARLDFQPSSSQEFFSMVRERLQGREQELDVHLLTDVVWSLCVLQQPRATHLRQVLAPDFHSRLQGDSSPRAQSSRLKLLHINATARLETPGYQGPFLPPEALGGHGDRDRDRDKATPLQRGLREALPGALGGHDLVRYDVSTVYGWDIDAEVLLDSEHRALPPRDFSAPHLPHSEGTKPLPPGARRVAVPCPCPQGGRALSLSPGGPCPVPVPRVAVPSALSLSLSPGWLVAVPCPCPQGGCAQCPVPVPVPRVAVLRWELPQFSSRGRELLGRGSMARRHLRAAGFLLAEVPHYEFLELKLERQRVAYLKDKVAKALASDTAGDTATDTAA